VDRFIEEQIKILKEKNKKIIENLDEKQLENLELLLPAGDLTKLFYAFKFGADAVYAGLPYYSLRIKENRFNYEKLLKAIDYTKKLDKKIYITVNIYPRGNFNEQHFLSVIDEIYSKGADALIMSDIGLINLVHENFDIPIHLSVQANATNYLAVKAWKKLGITRVILPRELILEEIKNIREKVPDIELEYFVHGSICIAYSGRCLISAYMSKRLANLGQCNNACRWKYRVYLEEENRPGQLYYIEEDDFGTYFFNSRDYNLLLRLPELIEAGIISFKVEGRNKTEYYVGQVAKAYREALDKIKNKEEPDWEKLMKELDKAPHRPWLTTFMNEKTAPWLQDYNYTTSVQTHWYLGRIIGKFENYFVFEIKHRVQKNDEVEIINEKETKIDIVEEIIKIKEKPELDDFGFLKESEKNKRLLNQALRDFDERNVLGGGAYALIKFKNNLNLKGYEFVIKKKEGFEKVKIEPLNNEFLKYFLEKIK
jgi:putative protease